MTRRVPRLEDYAIMVLEQRLMHLERMRLAMDNRALIEQQIYSLECVLARLYIPHFEVSPFA